MGYIYDYIYERTYIWQCIYHALAKRGNKIGIPVICEHAIAYAIAYLAKICISHILPHIMAFSKFQIFVYAFRIFICAKISI